MRLLDKLVGYLDKREYITFALPWLHAVIERVQLTDLQIMAKVIACLLSIINDKQVDCGYYLSQSERL